MTSESETAPRPGPSERTAPLGGRPRRVPPLAEAIGWLVPFGIVLYLALRGGGFDAAIRGEAGIVVWVVVIAAIATGVARIRGVSRAAWLVIALLSALFVWTALGMLWSESAGRTFEELTRVGAYFGVFLIGLQARGIPGLRRTVNAVGVALAIVAGLALLSRLRPELFPVDELAKSLPAVRARLNYPLNYWNGVATLVAMGIPLVLWIAAYGRTFAARVLATTALPIMALTIFYTFSRGGAAEALLAVAVLVAIAPRRLALTPPLAIAGVGSAVLIGSANDRPWLADQVLDEVRLPDQQEEMIAIVLLVCAAVALLSVAAGLVQRYRIGPRPSLPAPSRHARLAMAAVAGIAFVAVVIGAQSKLSDAWADFTSAEAAGTSTARLTSTSGSGRAQYWQSSLDAFADSPLTGTGPGTFEFWWQRNATVQGNVRDAHSLYFESLAEAGVVGVALIVAALGVVLVFGVRRLRGSPDRRSMLAAALAGIAVFLVAMGIDWGWEIGAIPVAFLLLAAAMLQVDASPDAPRERGLGTLRRPRVLGVLAVGALTVLTCAMISYATHKIRSSQEDARDGDFDAALASAEDARSALPFSGFASIQVALVLEARGDLDEAADAAQDAVDKESTNWETWFTLARIERARGNEAAAAEAIEETERLNPQAPSLDDG